MSVRQLLLNARTSGPVTLRSDNFTRSNSTTTINPPSDGAGNYTVASTSSVFGINSNRGYVQTTDGGYSVRASAVLNAGSGKALSYIECNITRSVNNSNGQGGLLGQWSNTTGTSPNGYRHLAFDVPYGGTTNRVYRVDSGSSTQLGADITGQGFAASPGTTYRFDFSAGSGSIRLYSSGVLRGTRTDSTYNTQTYFGINAVTSGASTNSPLFTALSIVG